MDFVFPAVMDMWCVLRGKNTQRRRWGRVVEEEREKEEEGAEKRRGGQEYSGNMEMAV